MTIYIDKDFKCHMNDAVGYRKIETNAFNGKCPELIEGYCYDDSNGYVTVYPWKPYEELAAAQAQYEHEQYSAITAERDALLDDLASLIDEVYTMDSEMMEE